MFTYLKKIFNTKGLSFNNNGKSLKWIEICKANEKYTKNNNNR